MKYICLDIGSVLCSVNMEPFLELLSETVNITIAEATRFLKRFQMMHDLGYTTMEDELKDTFNIKSVVTLNKLVSHWNLSITPYVPILDKLNNLIKQYDLKVALLSNIGTEHAKMMEDKLKHNGFFPEVIKYFSCNVGARKPSLIYYQCFLLQYPEFKGCLYVDDLQENLDASKLFGFQTFRLSLDEPGAQEKINEIEQLIINSTNIKKQ